MTTQQFLANISATYVKGIGIIERKNKDYAGSADPFKNFKSAEVVGIGVERAILLRVLDKIARVSNLLEQTPAVVEEAVEDTLVDAINYLAILKAYRERDKIIPTTGAGDQALNLQLSTISQDELDQLYRSAKAGSLPPS